MFKRIEQLLKLDSHNFDIRRYHFQGWNTEETIDPSGDLFKTYVEDKRVSFATIEDKLKNLQNSTPLGLPPLPQDLRNLYTVLLSHLKVYTI